MEPRTMCAPSGAVSPFARKGVSLLSDAYGECDIVVMICDERENPTRVCFDCVLCVSDGLCVCSLVILVVLCVCVPLSKICVWRDSLVAPTTTPRTGRRDGSLSRLANAASAGGVARGREVLENIPSLVSHSSGRLHQRSGVRESHVCGGAATWPSLAAVAAWRCAAACRIQKCNLRLRRAWGARPGPAPGRRSPATWANCALATGPRKHQTKSF